MGDFSVSWLDLREDADRRARNQKLLSYAAGLLSGDLSPLVVDLGCGTGSTFRALQPLLPERARWRFVDKDKRLLEEARRRAAESPVETVAFDLAQLQPLPLSGAGLVTASALFDLVSETFIERFVAMLASQRAAVYAALSYDGTTTWDPVHPLDSAVLAAFNRDQRTDKGFGVALGPDGVTVLADRLDRAGYRVAMADSPWTLGPDDATLTQELLRGIATAVLGEGSLAPEAIDEWLAFRLDHGGTGQGIIGHQDLVAEPM